jgi:hypothetical protein
MGKWLFAKCLRRMGVMIHDQFHGPYDPLPEAEV